VPRRKAASTISFKPRAEVEESLNGDYELGDWSGRQLVTDDKETFYHRIASTVTVSIDTSEFDSTDPPFLSRTTAAATSGARIPMVMPEKLSKCWAISIQTAKNTIKFTTKRGV
jgi:hypothetical protein